MSAHIAQRLIASVFLILGGWCLIAPGSVIALTVRPEYVRGGPLEAFAIGCFGAQAVLSGLFAWFATFTRKTFLAYGIALMPFFVFNYYFYAVEPLLGPLGLLDLLGNCVMLALCVVGYRASDSLAPPA